jgi:hypothetical protein
MKQTIMNDNDDIGDLRAEKEKLLGEVARLQASKEFGVPPAILGQANTLDEARALAEQALQWRGSVPPAPPQQTAAVSPYNGVGQISRSTLPYLSPADTMAAWRAGRLQQAGAAPPPPRANGEHGATH